MNDIEIALGAKLRKITDLVKEVKKIAKENLDGYDVHFAGQPYLTGETPNLISEDIKILMMIGIFIMLIILGINLKSIYAVFSVLVTILLSLRTQSIVVINF